MFAMTVKWYTMKKSSADIPYFHLLLYFSSIFNKYKCQFCNFAKVTAIMVKSMCDYVLPLIIMSTEKYQAYL
jgi:hypothetical protein